MKFYKLGHVSFSNKLQYSKSLQISKFRPHTFSTYFITDFHETKNDSTQTSVTQLSLKLLCTINDYTKVAGQAVTGYFCSFTTILYTLESRQTFITQLFEAMRVSNHVY